MERLTLLRFTLSENPGYIAVHNKDHIGFQNILVRSDSDATVGFVITSNRNIRSDRFHNADG